MLLQETDYEHASGDDFFLVTASERWSITMMRKLKRDRPDEVTIEHENPDGSLIAKVPYQWMKIRPKRRVNLTDEKIRQLRERSKLNRETRVLPAVPDKINGEDDRDGKEAD